MSRLNWPGAIGISLLVALLLTAIPLPDWVQQQRQELIEADLQALLAMDPGQDPKVMHVVRDTVLGVLLADYLASGARARPRSLQAVLPAQGPPATRSGAGLAPRQQQHGQGANAPMITP